MSVEPSVVIAAGGTGGHIYPGLAVAEALRRLQPDVQVTFVGTNRGLEQRLIPEAGWELRMVPMVPFRGIHRLELPFRLAQATVHGRRIIRDVAADVVVGMGGYASIPLITAAKLTRTPAVIHESGAIPGRANLLAARLTGNVALSFEKAASYFSSSITPRVVGMPLAGALAGFDRDTLRSEARAAFGVADDVTLVVVNGGSQGSVTLNGLAVDLAQRWRERDDVRLLVKPGRDHIDDVEARLRATGGDRVATAVAYFERMDHVYAAADLAVTRAGAGTVAELAMTGVPAILVPYPYAPMDHQAVNASVLTDNGAALMVRDPQATGDALGPTLEELLADPDRLAGMAKAAAALGRPHAADDFAAWVLELGRRSGAGGPEGRG